MTAMIFFRLILHPAVSIYDFHILSRVYNEPTKCPAPSWLESCTGIAQRSRVRIPYKPEFFQAFFSHLQKLRL